MDIRLDGQVAIITGAGGGLGRAHALELAGRGAHVIVNDVHSPAGVVDEIAAQGGAAQALQADITDAGAVAAMLAQVLAEHGRVDIVDNAGILRDKSFGNMTLEEFRAVLEVHLLGAFHLTHGLWGQMKQQKYGRILFTSSPSGLYGNFGQANYAAAKMALVGLMHTLAIEGAKYDIRANALAPLAATQMTRALLPEEARDAMSAEAVSPGVALLVSKDAPNGVILCAAGGRFSVARLLESEGAGLAGAGAEDLQARWDEIGDMRQARGFASLPEQMEHVIARLGGDE